MFYNRLYIVNMFFIYRDNSNESKPNIIPLDIQMGKIICRHFSCVQNKKKS